MQPRPWPGLQLLQRGRAGASSAAVPPRGEAGRGVLHVRGQVRHKYLHIYISTYLHLRGRDTRTAADLQHCSSLCHQAPYCRSFTYKWVAALHSDRLTPTLPRTNYYLATSNCYLSELAAAAVQQRDLQQDSEWTLYEALDGRDCGHGGGGGDR